MENLKAEFLKHTGKVTSKVKCVALKAKTYRAKQEKIELYPNYSTEDYVQFLEILDFDYDSGYGSQGIYGFIWYEDGTFSERGEYDGSEWFSHVKTPEIPVDLLVEGEKNLLNNLIVNTTDGQKKKRL